MPLSKPPGAPGSQGGAWQRGAKEHASGTSVRFSVSYWTQWGQNLVLAGAGAVLGDWDVSRGQRMTCRHSNESLVWECVVTLPAGMPYIEYSYSVVGERGNVDKREAGHRRLRLPPTQEGGLRVEVNDAWQNVSPSSVIMRCTPLRQAVGLKKTPHHGPPPEALEPEDHGYTVVRLIVRDWLCEDYQQLCVSGSIPELGNWQPDKTFGLVETDTPIWEGEVLVPTNSFPFTYKYAIRDDSGTILESGESRVASLPRDADKFPILSVFEDGDFRHEKLWRAAGIVVPVFSLRTTRSVGVGEFLDLKLLVDFCASCGFQAIQILPVNDTSVYRMWWDSYPYGSVSAFALHPIYLSLEALCDEPPVDIQERMDAARRKLDLADVHYEETLQAKMNIAKAIFHTEEGKRTLQSAAFLEFCQRNADWLRPYAAFCFLRDLFGTSEHWNWGTLKRGNTEVVDRLTNPEEDYHGSIQFIYYVQYHLHSQLLSVRKYAEEHCVMLKGDLPIGIHKQSTDAWLCPSLFHMDKSTGAPPDVFDPNGQNWGFPTYNWEEMAKDNYKWLRKRLKRMSEYFHAYRIDHILGFFRIWEIPDHCVHGLLGRFRPCHPISRQELEENGIWDIDRLCEPYVPWHLLEETFGNELASEISWKYFTESHPKMYRLREEYNTEKKIANIVPRRNSQWLIDEINVTKEGLLKLLHNVVLIREPNDRNAFYPRFDMTRSNSFQELDHDWREKLARLHWDYFFHRQDGLWRSHGLRCLPILMDSSDMLVCGEDLGMIPGCVHPVMEELGLIGMRIQRMPSDGAQFGTPSKYPYLAVCSPSCHDTLTTRAWFEEDADRRESFCREHLGIEGPAPSTCTPFVMGKIVQQHMNSPSVLAMFPIQDIFALTDNYNDRPSHEETINKPTNPRHYWRYRMHVTLESLCEADELLDLLSAMVKDGYRGPKWWRGDKVCHMNDSSLMEGPGLRTDDATLSSC